MNRKLVAGFCFALLGAVAPLGAQTSRVVAVRAGHLFNSKAGTMLTNQVVLVDGEKITDVGPADRVQIPAGTQVIDLSQATVLPGLIDAHTHVYSSLSNGARVTTTKEAWTLMAIGNAQTTLRAGFTTVRDVGTHGEG
jgi:imidazolonepropionase-like amidohydrolase